MADFETIKSKCGMSFFLFNPFWELLPIRFTLSSHDHDALTREESLDLPVT